MTNQKLWWKNSIVYQIYPRSFMDSNGDGIGDLKGIISKLDYIKRLGVGAIWLSPIYPTPDADFGYDVADYRDVDPKFGTLEIFDCFQKEAHKRGIKVIMDLVLNHSSNEHQWFVEARKNKENPFRNYYIWADGKNGQPPNNWGGIFGGSAWEWDDQAQQYYLHLFYKEQPDLNWRNPKVYEEMMNIFKFWCDRGVDGFRLDVFNLYYKHAEFLDNPKRFPPSAPYGRKFDWQYHKYDYDQPEMIPALEDIRKILDTYPERYAIGETFPEMADTAATYSAPGRLHAAFNFSFLHSKWNPADFLKTINYWEELPHDDYHPTYVLGNHDVPRLATRYAKGEEDARMRVAAVMLLTLRGTPYLYFGDEIGMRDIPIRRKKDILDPIGKRYFPLMVGRDGCRAPMQWNDSPHAGFTTAQSNPWLPVHKNVSTRNVEAQEKNPNSLLHHYRQIIKIRNEHQALHAGDMQILDEQNEALLTYERTYADERIFICLNFSNKPHNISLSNISQATTLLYASERENNAIIDFNNLTIKADEALIIKIQ